MEQKQEYAIFGRQVGYVIGVNISTSLLAFIQLPILTRALGANLYGTWALINVTIYLLFPFALLGLSVAIVRFLAVEKDPGRIREDFISVCFIVCTAGVVLSLLLFLLSDYLAAYIFRDVSSSSYFRLASVLILFNAMGQLFLAFFRVKRRIGLYTIIALMYNVSQAGLIILFTLLGYKLTGAITALIISGVLFTLINLSIILKEIGFQLPRFTHMKSYLRWGLPLTSNEAILWIITTSDRYMVSYFLGVAAAGIYNAAYSIGNYASFALTPLGIVLYPNVIKSYEEGNPDVTRNYFKYSVKYLMMITIPCAFGISILAKPLLQILTTPEFTPGSNVVPFVAFGGVVYCFYYIGVYVIQMAGKTELVIMLLGIAAGLNILLNFILIPRMGIVGAALATLVAYAALGMLSLIVSRRYFKLDLDIPSIVKSFLASAVMAFCIWLIAPDSIATVVISIFAGVIVYFAVLLLIKTISKEELAFFTSFLRRQRKVHLVK
jgi:O-antigen/teichoic acid export membrane protein